jgi:hypothetical protein
MKPEIEGQPAVPLALAITWLQKARGAMKAQLTAPQVHGRVRESLGNRGTSTL